MKSYWRDPKITRRLDSQSLKMDNKRRGNLSSLQLEVWTVRTLLPGRCRFDRRDQQRENIKVWLVSSLISFGSSWNKNGSYHWCDPLDPLKHRSQSSSCGTRTPKFQVHYATNQLAADLGNQITLLQSKLCICQVEIATLNLSTHRAARRSEKGDINGIENS